MKIIIVGAGEVGYHIASKLSKENKDVVLIDLDAERLKQVSETLDVQTLHGSGASPTLLRAAGIESADMIIAVTDSDEANLISCLMSRLISAGTTRIARIRNQDYFDIEGIKTGEVLGLSLVINPEIEVVKKILSLLEVPGAVDVVDFADGLVRLIGLKINVNSHLAGLTMAELREIDPEQHILIAAIYRNNSVIIPRGDTRLEAGDLVYLPARPEEVERILQIFGWTSTTVRNIFIVGGGQVGRQLALALEDQPVTVKLIERKAEICRELGEILNKTIVLKGEGTDQSLLEEENVADADCFIALTNDEEENVLACLQAKQLGVKQAITRVNKVSYINLVTAIGLETVVSSRLSAISVILQHIRRGKVVSVATLKGEDAEAIEFVALESSDIVGKTIEQIKFPHQALIAAIVRENHVIIPRGQTIIQPDDRIIIFTRREAVSKVEKAFMVKLEYF
ncbi:MAG: Trk system potassium transporter TrkA [Deltaproteobacteria bacterium]|nr:Trk system potassium transporter TrkA [Deltaproteobacteria bacterium]